MTAQTISSSQIPTDVFTHPFHHMIARALMKTPFHSTRFFKSSHGYAVHQPEMGFSFHNTQDSDLKEWAQLLYDERITLMAGEYDTHFRLLQTIGDIVPADSPVDVFCRYEVQEFCIHETALEAPPSDLKLNQGKPQDLDKLYFFYQQSLNMKRTKVELKRNLAQDKVIYLKKLGKVASAALTHCETDEAGLIGGVYTPKMHRQKGYSKACMLELMHWLKRENKTPCLFYEKNNTPAKNLYQKLGFKPIGDWVIIELIYQDKPHEPT